MSGGFFRGTSADQDTRFSNKQAKLLKSQKFALELENLVDMTKVSMDVMRPWIAKRVTELIGFEDEVLINFIYGLLEGKAVNGKQIQIQLTGFMERNTGKFMKELWALLLSAQQNVSGVPQQFLDAKEEETKMKQAETDRIVNEIQRKKEKEKQEVEQEKKKMGGDGARPRDKHAEFDLDVKDDAGASSIKSAEEKERYKRNGRRRHGRDSQSPDSSHHSPSLRQKRSTSHSKSPNPRAYEPPSKSRSISSERQHHHSSPKRSVTPQRRHISRRSPPPWRRSPHSKRLSPSHSRRRSPSPRRRSPSPRRRTPSPRRITPSPTRNMVRSPRRHRSRSPVRRRSRTPVRRRSRTPIRRSSVRYRSRSPLRRRSPFPARRRSPSPPLSGRRRSPSPHQQSPSSARRRYQRSPPTPGQQSVSPVQRRSSMHGRKRLSTQVTVRSPQGSSSPSDTRRSSLSPVRKGSIKSTSSPIQYRGERARRHEKYSPARHASPKERIEPPFVNSERKPAVSLRSPQKEMLDRDDLTGKEREFSPPLADASRARSCSEDRRSLSPRTRERISHPENSIPVWKAGGGKPYRGSSGTSADVENNLSSREIGEYNNRSLGKNSQTSLAHKDSLNLSQKTTQPSSDLTPGKMRHKEHSERQELSEIEGAHTLSSKFGKNGTFGSPTEGSDDYRGKIKEKRKHYKSHRQEVESDDCSSNDSYEGRKEAKRRKREEKKLKKEERRQRREDRRRRKDGSHSEKLRLKSGNAGSLSSDHSEDDSVRRKNPRASYTQETESEQKRHEIQLREKALESLRAKKGIGN